MTVKLQTAVDTLLKHIDLLKEDVSLSTSAREAIDAVDRDATKVALGVEDQNQRINKYRRRLEIDGVYISNGETLTWVDNTFEIDENTDKIDALEIDIKLRDEKIEDLIDKNHQLLQGLADLANVLAMMSGTIVKSSK